MKIVFLSTRASRPLTVTALLAAAFITAAPHIGATVDAASNTLAAAGSSGRVVSVGGAVTEILYALGLEERVVGVDTTSLFPPRALAQKPNVGYMRQLSPEGILGLNPQAIVAIEGAGPKETMAVLKEAKVPLVSVPEDYSEAGLSEKIRLIAKQMGVENRGTCLTTAVEGDFAEVRALREKIQRPVRVIFVMSLVSGRAMVAGRKTGADSIIALAGGVNAIDSYEGYKQVSEEAIVASRPDVILAMQRSGDSVTADAVFANSAFALTPAAKTKSFVSMDGLYLLGFGPRTAAAAHDLAGAFYPDLKVANDSWKPRVLSADCRN